MRRLPTEAEAALWFALRDRRLDDLKFRRQFRVGRFIADFCCPAQRLIVELDGGVHERQAEADRQRTEWLESVGYRVLRFENDEVVRDLGDVVERIYRAARGPA